MQRTNVRKVISVDHYITSRVRVCSWGKAFVFAEHKLKPARLPCDELQHLPRVVENRLPNELLLFTVNIPNGDEKSSNLWEKASVSHSKPHYVSDRKADILPLLMLELWCYEKWDFVCRSPCHSKKSPLPPANTHYKIVGKFHIPLPGFLFIYSSEPIRLLFLIKTTRTGPSFLPSSHLSTSAFFSFLWMIC